MLYPAPRAATGSSARATARPSDLFAFMWNAPGGGRNDTGSRARAPVGGGLRRARAVHLGDHPGKALGDDAAPHLERRGELARLLAQIAIEQGEALDLLERGEFAVQPVHLGLD